MFSTSHIAKKNSEETQSRTFREHILEIKQDSSDIALKDDKKSLSFYRH